MIEWFKEGKSLPKRYVWEIILGAHEHFSKEESMVSVDIPEGITCDVIGDVHGESTFIRRAFPRINSTPFVGQFYDMLHLYSLTGQPSDKHMLLMNGDLVDVSDKYQTTLPMLTLVIAWLLVC